MIQVLEISIDIDLALFSRHLWQLGIRHRIFEASGRQQLWVENPDDKAEVIRQFDLLRSGQLQLEKRVREDIRPGVSVVARFTGALKRFPACLFFIFLSVLCYPLTWGIDQGQIGPWLHYFTYTDFAISGDHILFAPFSHGMDHGQVWRLWTPMLIHFGLIHITFNLLWLWEIGRRIELRQGSARLINIVMISALVSNGVQHLMSGEVLFGGMSGVVYGLLGYALVWSRLRPAQSFGLPNGIYVFMLIWLALGFSGLIDVLGFGSIANGAHLGGLVAGAGVGLIAVLFASSRAEQQ